MKKVLLHIGTGKTGTSTIQNSLYKNRKELRNRFSIDYAKVCLKLVDHFGETIAAHYPLVDAIKSRDSRKLEKVTNYIDKSVCETVIFSCENLYHSLEESDVDWLSKALQNYHVMILCYVRRQDLYIESAYRQQVKVGEFKMKFDDFLKRHVDRSYLTEVHANYYAMLEKWRESFGASSLVVRPFDQRLFYHGTLLNDYSNVLGLKEATLETSSKNNTNLKLPRELINVVRLSNSLQIVPRDHQQSFVQFLSDHLDFRDSAFLNPSERDLVLKNYEEVNKKLCKRFDISEEWMTRNEKNAPIERVRTNETVLVGILYALFCQMAKPSRLNRIKIRLFFFGKDLIWLLRSLETRSISKDKSIALPLRERFFLIAKGAFSPTFYLTKYEDVRKKGVDPFMHYETHGKKERRLPHPTYSRLD